MDRTSALELSLHGGDVRPETTPIEDLGNLLVHLHKVVDALSPAQRDTPKPRLALVSLKESSTVLGFSADAPAQVSTALERFLEAVRSRALSDLPDAVKDAVRFVHGFCRRRDAVATFRYQDAEAVIDGSTEFTFARPRVVGSTTLYAEVERAGGAEPKVVLLLEPKGIRLSCTVTREQAEELGAYLYHTVCLQGEAQWEHHGGLLEVVGFHVDKVVEFKNPSLEQAFRDLAWLDEKTLWLREGDDSTPLDDFRRESER